MRSEEVRGQNRAALLFLTVGFVLSVIVMTLPLYIFHAGVYTKKSANTFHGDEKYTAVYAETEQIAQEYREKGFDVEIKEDVLTRVNSKGETTSLITFTIEETKGKNLWSFTLSSLPSGHLFRFMLCCCLLSLICGAFGLAGTADILQRFLPGRAKILRTLSVAFAVLSFLAVPVFAMLSNYAFSRRLSLYREGHIEEGKDAFFSMLDAFLFDGTAGENIESMLAKLDIHRSGLYWLLLPCFFIMITAAVQIRHGMIKNTLLRMLLYVFVAAVCLVTVYPYFVMLVTGFRSNAETLDMYFLHILPTQWMFRNLTDILSRGVGRYLFNSLLVAGGATAIAMLCGVPAAYALARMKFRGKKIFLGFVIVSQMFSPVVLLIGISQLMNTLHLNNTITGLMLINAAFNQAFAIWLLRGTFISISPEMEEAALIDGCGTVRALTKVLIPMAAPGIVTALIFVFINAWNEYTISTVLISTAAKRPITVGITQFSSFNMIEWQYLFAASLLATIPVVILFMFIEKHLTAGLTSGGVKG